MPAPPAYLDECIDHDVLDALRVRGFAVTSAREQHRANISFSDDQQLAFAHAHGWVIVTHNERHFRALADRHRREDRSYGGSAVVPARPPFERVLTRTAMMLDWLGTMPDYRSRLFKWGHLQELLEQGYRLPGYNEDDVRFALARP
jgi:hypothetical protein